MKLPPSLYYLSIVLNAYRGIAVKGEGGGTQGREGGRERTVRCREHFIHALWYGLHMDVFTFQPKKKKKSVITNK